MKDENSIDLINWGKLYFSNLKNTVNNLKVQLGNFISNKVYFYLVIVILKQVFRL
jgi:hypothetical protein